MEKIEKWGWINLNKSSVVTENSCLISAVILTSDGVGSCSCTLFDSKGSEDNKICNLRASQYQSTIVNFDRSIYCANGLYVKLGDNVESVTIFFKPAN